MTYDDYLLIASRGNTELLQDPHFDDVAHRQQIMQMDINGRIRNNITNDTMFPQEKIMSFLYHIPSLKAKMRCIRQLLKKGFYLKSHQVNTPENIFYHSIWLCCKMKDNLILREKATAILSEYAQKDKNDAFLLAELQVPLPIFKEQLGMAYSQWYEQIKNQNILELSPLAWKQHVFSTFCILMGFDDAYSEVELFID